jgi:hypothetical protein
MGSGSIRVLQAGADTPGQLRQAQADLCDAAGADVLELDLALDKPANWPPCSVSYSYKPSINPRSVCRVHGADEVDVRRNSEGAPL